jgi:hypothetical protein
VMMQAAEDGPRFDAPEGGTGRLVGASLFKDRSCSAPIVVARITAQQMEKVALSQDNHVIQTVPSDRTDRPFAISVLPTKPANEIARPRRTRAGCRRPSSGGSIVRLGFICQRIGFPIGTTGPKPPR